jgi:sialic acid synthase SpsE
MPQSVFNLKEYIDKNNVFITADLGQNHNGSVELAKKMIDELSNIQGVSAVKLFKRDLDLCLNAEQKKKLYINPNSFGETYLEHRQALELSEDKFIELKQYTERKGLIWFSTASDINSLKFLASIKCPIIKIPSMSNTDIEFLKEVAKTNIPVILSSGMSDLKIMDKAVNILKNSLISVMQCTAAYPCPDRLLNLNVLDTLKEKYSDIVNQWGYNIYLGFSGHHTGVVPDSIAYMKGARTFERHFTLDRAMKGTDHSASLEPKGMDNMCRYIKQTIECLGNSNKYILLEEVPFMNKLRKVM